MKKIFLESKNGYFGEGDSKFGGCFVPETLYGAVQELQSAYKEIFHTKDFKDELKGYRRTFVGRPTPLIYAKNVSQMLGNEIYLKYEGLANTGAHKINNALSQVLLAKKMGKTQVIAETGAGQHGLATASVCAFLKIPCKIFMGEIDVARQRPNVFIMEQFGAEVVPVSSGSKTLKDAVNEALREWSKNPNSSFYVLGSALGPYPYPDIVREAQSIIGKEIKKQLKKQLGMLPDYIVACVGGGSNALGAFSAFLEYGNVRLVGVEAGGDDFMKNKNAMRLSPQSDARVGIAHGYRSLFLQDKNGQLADTHSISAGLDYAGVSPQLAHLRDIGRVEFMAASDKEALQAMQFFARHEGILAALESSHALSGVINITKHLSNKIIVANVSGRGDKDIFITAKALQKKQWREFLQSEVESMTPKAKFALPQKKQEDESINYTIHHEEFKNHLEELEHENLEFIDSDSVESNVANSTESASTDNMESNVDSIEIAEISKPIESSESNETIESSENIESMESMESAKPEDSKDSIESISEFNLQQDAQDLQTLFKHSKEAQDIFEKILDKDSIESDLAQSTATNLDSIESTTPQAQASPAAKKNDKTDSKKSQNLDSKEPPIKKRKTPNTKSLLYYLSEQSYEPHTNLDATHGHNGLLEFLLPQEKGTSDADIIADMFKDVLFKDNINDDLEYQYEIGDYCDLESRLDEINRDLADLESVNATAESSQDSIIESSPVLNNTATSRIFETSKDLSKIWGKSLNA